MYLKAQQLAYNQGESRALQNTFTLALEPSTFLLMKVGSAKQYFLCMIVL